jgi:hypothetical protein
MWVFARSACGAPLNSWVEHHGAWLVFLGLALAVCDFLDGFAWIRSRFLDLRTRAYAALHPSMRPLSVGVYWLISVLLLVAALSWSVTTFAAGGAPIRFFVYTTLGLAVIVRLYLVIYAVEKRQLSHPPQRPADRLFARLSTEPMVSSSYAGPADNDAPRPSANAFRLLLLVPLTYLWQTLAGIISILIWALYAPVWLIAWAPGRLVGFLGVALAAAAFWLTQTCR